MAKLSAKFIYSFVCFIGHVASTTDNSGPRDWCKIPGLPLRIVEAFQHHNRENDSSPLAGIEYVPAVAQGEWYRLDTTVFVGCIDGYTAISADSLRISCVTNQSGQAAWNGTLPTCKRNVCWWFGSEEAIEFRHGDQKLADQAGGFPEGTTIHSICPDGKKTSNTTLKCLTSGVWSGNVSSCEPIKVSHIQNRASHQQQIMRAGNRLISNDQLEMFNSKLNRLSAASWLTFSLTISILLIVVVIFVIRFRSAHKMPWEN